MKQAKNNFLGLHIFLKAMLIVFLGVLLYFIVTYCTDSLISYNNEKLDKTESIERCDSRYYDREFGQLREILLLYDLFDPSLYGKYWEAVNAYEDYTYYLQWEQAALQGAQGAEAKLETYREKVEDNSINCRYTENTEVLKQYAQRCTNQKQLPD